MLRLLSDLFRYVQSARKLRRPVPCAGFSTVSATSSDYSNLLYHNFLRGYSFSFGTQFQYDTFISVFPFCEFTTLYYRGECTAPVFSCRGLQAGKILPAFPLLALPLLFFNTIFFIMTGGRKSRQVSEQRNPYFRRTQQPANCPPFFRHLWMVLNSIFYPRNGHGYTPVPSVLSSHCKHGLSVRMFQSLLTFSGGVRPVAATGIQGVRPSFFSNFFSKLRLIHGGVRPAAAIGNRAVRPSFLRLCEQFFHNKLNDWGMGAGRPGIGFSRAFAPIHCFSYENRYY